MAGGHVVSLKVGLPYEGKDNQKAVELQEPDAGMIIDARVASERLVTLPSEDGPMPALVPSPAKVRSELLRRMIVKVGEIPGNPLSEELFRKFKGADLGILEDFALRLDAAALQEVGTRGRDHKGGGQRP